MRLYLLKLSAAPVFLTSFPFLKGLYAHQFRTNEERFEILMISRTSSSICMIAVANKLIGRWLLKERQLLVSLLGLLAKIMCSICSCQLNIWHARHSLAPILNCFLIFDHGNEVYFSLVADCPGIALPPGTVHSQMKSMF